MNINFADLELLAEQSIEFDAEALLTTAKSTYEDAPLHELFDRLESAVESYTLVQVDLSTVLRDSAEQEIEFFLSLLQERLNALLEPSQPMGLPRQIQFA